MSFQYVDMLGLRRGCMPYTDPNAAVASIPRINNTPTSLYKAEVETIVV